MPRGLELHAERPVQERMARIERGLVPPLRVRGESYGWTLLARMQKHRVPAVSIAVWRDYRLDWAKAYGVADVDRAAQATLHTLFQAGSISKPVAAMAALKAVERGELTLDGPINRELKSWSLPDNEFTQRSPVTLRHLLSHTGGTTVSGFPGYVAGAPVPTIPQILDGIAPAQTEAVRVDLAPGTRYRYSGGGTTIVQLALTDRLGRSFPDIMADTVLGPLRMASSTFEQVLPAGRSSLAAAGHDADGKVIEGKRRVYPEMAAAGLWTNPTDLAAFFSEIQLALASRSSRVSRTVAEQMIAPVTRTGDDGVGLGLYAFAPGTSSEWAGRRVSASYFGHSGVDAGFQAIVFASREGGHGVAIMANSDNGGAIFRELFRAVFAEYGWGDEEPALEPARVTRAYLESIAGRYSTGRVTSAMVTVTGDRLTVERPYREPLVLLPVGDDTFAGLEDGRRYRIAPDRAQIVRLQKRGPAESWLQRGPAETWLRQVHDSPMPDRELEAGRFDAALAAVRRLIADHGPDAIRVEHSINTFGLALLGRERNTAAAIAVLHLNTAAFPDSMRAYDSLAVAYARAGKKGDAIAAFRAVLAAKSRDDVTPTALKEELARNAEKQLRVLDGP